MRIPQATIDEYGMQDYVDMTKTGNLKREINCVNNSKK